MIAGVVTGIRVSHDHASIGEVACACEPDERRLLGELLAHDSVTEAFVLQTCNRSETYVVTDDRDEGERVLAAHAPDVDPNAVVWMDHEDSLRHLLRVAAGLESLVLGEDQILGQLREAYEDARREGAVGYVLDDALLKAIHVGERARTETSINEGVVSLASAAVRLAAERRPIEGATALVVGAGEMGSLAARALVDEGVDRLLVANRTVRRARLVVDDLAVGADDVEVGAVGLDALDEVTDRADVVVSATGSDRPVLDSTTLDGGGETLVVDIAQPRDVAPDAESIDGVTVLTLDSLRSVTDRTKRQRETAAREVEAMIDREFERLLVGFKRKQADGVIATMYESAERVKRRELETAVSKLDAREELGDEGREIVESLADALVGHLMAAPTKSLREAAANDDWSTINTALRLFDPEFGSDPAVDRLESATDESKHGRGPTETVSGDRSAAAERSVEPIEKDD